MIKAAFIHIPKTGGTSIRAMFKGHLFNLQHAPLDEYPFQFGRKHEASRSDWDALYKFAFVRNPWDRYAAFYLHHLRSCYKRGIMDDVEPFDVFIDQARTRLLGKQNPKQMFYGWQEEIGHVFQFEKFEHAVIGISAALEIPVPEMQHLNQNEIPREKDWRPLYTDYTREAVAKFGAWEIERFGYTFDDCLEVAA